MISLDKITSLAQDSDDIERAKHLANKRKWRQLEVSDTSVWGEVKSSGAVYYKTQFIPKTLQFKCNCPSRKKPCIHALSLMMIYVQKNELFDFTLNFPEWVNTWLAIKDKPKKTERTEAEEAKLAQLRLKTREKRLAQMDEGLNELGLWLKDIMQQGLANLEVQPPDFWEGITGRLVNAKCGSLANRIRTWPTLIGSLDWHEKILSEIGELFLLLKGFQNIQQLPPPLQQEILNQSGINIKKEELIGRESVRDTWLVVGQVEGKEEESNLFFRRTWLAGEKSQKVALLLEYAWGTTPYETSFQPGNQFRGDVVFYPSAFPLRIALQHFEKIVEPFLIYGYPNFTTFSNNYAAAIGANPWLTVFPAILEEVIPIYFENIFFILDKNKRMLPLKTEENIAWQMISLSGGHPITVFGQWENQLFEPLSAMIEDQFILLKETKPLPRPKQTWRKF